MSVIILCVKSETSSGWAGCCGIIGNVSWRGQDGAELEGEVSDLPVDLRSNPHLWSWELGNGWEVRWRIYVAYIIYVSSSGWRVSWGGTDFCFWRHIHQGGVQVFTGVIIYLILPKSSLGSSSRNWKALLKRRIFVAIVEYAATVMP